MLHNDFSVCHAGRCSVQPGIPSRCQTKPAASQSLKRKRSSLPVCAAAAVPEPVQNANTLPRNKTAGRSTYRPESFDEMVTDASSALVEAMEAGLSELEVEFPPLPSSVDSELCSAASACLSCALASYMLLAQKMLSTPYLCSLPAIACYKGASDDYIDANVRLAISGAVKVTIRPCCSHALTLPQPCRQAQHSTHQYADRQEDQQSSAHHRTGSY